MVIIVVGSHVAFAVEGFIPSEVITRRFLERDMSNRVGSSRSGSQGWSRSRGRSRSRSGGSGFTGGSRFAADSEVGRVPTGEVGLALVDLDTREVAMVLGIVHSVTKYKPIAGGAPFGQSFASVGDRDFFRRVHSGEILRHCFEAFLDEFVGFSTFRIGEAIDSFTVGVSVFICQAFGLRVGVGALIGAGAGARASGGFGLGVTGEGPNFVSE